MAANTHSLDLESGSSQYASITDASQTGLDITGDITFEAWVKFESLPSSGAVAIFGSRYNGTPASSAYQFYVYNNGGTMEAKFLVCSGSSLESYTKAFAFTAGQWYHYAVTWDASAATATFYINGVSIGTHTRTLTSINNSALNFWIGAGDSGPAGFFDGLIDEVRVWNDIRTSQEIIDNMYQDVTGQANLQGYWKLNNDYADSSGNGNTLTASGSPVFSTTTPFPTYTAVRQSALSETDLASDANLQGYYKLSDVTDTSSNGYDLTNNNSAIFTTGLFNNAVDLETSSSQYLSIADASCPSLELSGSRSISAWIKIEGIAAVMSVVGKRGTDYASNAGYILYVEHPTGRTHFTVDGLTTNTDVYTPFNLGTNTWYHVVGVYNGSQLQIYVNGVLAAAVTATGTGASSNSWPFCIGADNQGTSNAAGLFFDGMIDDVAIFNRALSAQEVLDIYTGTATGGNFFLMF